MTPLAAYNTQAAGQDSALAPVLWQDAALRRPGSEAAIAFAVLQSGQRRRSEATADRWQAAEAQVRDAANASPRRRASDSAQAPGFPSSRFVAQVLAQQAFPPNAVPSGSGLAAYEATLQRGRGPNRAGISLSV